MGEIGMKRVVSLSFLLAALAALAGCSTEVIDHSAPLDCSKGLIERTNEGATTLEIRTISEYGGTPRGGIGVQVDEQHWRTTDEDGRASMPLPSGPFRLRVHQATIRPEFRHDDIWELRTITGNDLTLCVDGTGVAFQSARIEGTLVGAAEDTRVLVYAAAQGIGPQGASVEERVAADVFRADAGWEGFGGRELDVFALESDNGSPPEQYQAYGSKTLQAPATEGNFLELTGVTLELEPIDQVRLGGTVSAPENVAGLQASLWLEVEGLQLVLGSGIFNFAPATFDYAFPTVDNTRGLVRVNGQGMAGAYTTHWRQFDPPASNLSFDLPPLLTPLSPTTGSSIAVATTVFSWSAGPSEGRTYLSFKCAWEDTGGQSRNVNFREVEAITNEVRLPMMPDLTIPAGTACEWSVLWRDAPSTDELRYSSSEIQWITTQ